MRALSLIILCVLLSNGNAQSTPKQVPKVSISVEPVSQPPVGTGVIIRCIGPLKSGAALVYDGAGNTRRGNPVVSFKMIEADGQAPNIEKTGGDADRYTIFLDSGRQGVKIKFRVKFSDNGFYRCVFYNQATNSVKMQTSSILIQSFYPPEEPRIEQEEVEKNGKFIVKVTCEAYVGYPSGNLELIIDGIKNLDTKKPKKTKAVGKRGYVYKTQAIIPATLRFNGTEAKCVAGGGENPLVLNSTQILDVEVPASEAIIKDPGVQFRPPGSRLVCEATGNPPPTYSWTLNHKELNTTESSIIVPKKTGIYSATCRVSNEVLHRNFTSEYHFHFAVLPESMPCSDIRKEDSAHTAFIIATVLAVIFAIIALIVVVILIVTKRKSGYDKM